MIDNVREAILAQSFRILQKRTDQGEVDDRTARSHDWIRGRAVYVLQLLFGRDHFVDVQFEIGAIDAFVKQPDVGGRQSELSDNVLLHVWSGGRRQRRTPL